jgi:D-tyrosyl-tRNA(Tyr) deacylase
MMALVQRVREASVEVDGEVVGSIGKGLLILLGVHRDDREQELDWVGRKCASLRIFSDDEGKMNRSVVDAGGEVLVVSQFTLYGSTARGNRPSFTDSAPPEQAERLYEQFVQMMSALIGRPVPTGVFGAHMQVRLQNDGPVTLIVEKKADAEPAR